MKKYLIAAFISFVVSTATAQGNNYHEDFQSLFDVLGKDSATIGLHQTDWAKVGAELLPKVDKVKSDDEFGRLCMEMIARLNDSHASLLSGTCEVPKVDLPVWDAGFACLRDADGNIVVYYVKDGSPADRKGVKPGMAVLEINGVGIGEAIKTAKRNINEYIGYSTSQYLDYHACRWFARQLAEDDKVQLILQDTKGRKKKVVVQAADEAGYLPRLPVPLDDISDGGRNIQWKKLDGNIGYIYVRRIKGDLSGSLDQAIDELEHTHGIIIDVRGNSGGGFDANTAHYNFDPESPAEPGRIKYHKPLALLISPRCISAGEGWASWFVANSRAKVFGEPTAGASGRKTVYSLPSGRFKVRYVVKPYKGYLERYIEGQGLEPDVPVVQTAEDLKEERDTVLEAAKEYLMAL